MAVSVKAYYDGSGADEGKARSISLAGYAGPPDFWAYFEERWKSVLAGDGQRPVARYLHMRDANALRGEFSPENGWTKLAVTALIDDVMKCLNAASNEHGDRVSGVSCTVRLDDYERALSVLPQLQNKEPAAICVDNCVTVALQLLPEAPEGQGILGKLDSIELYFDRNERFLHKINRIWNRPYAKRSKPLQLVHRIVSVDMKSTYPLQAADFLAWHTNRHLSSQDLLAGLRRVLAAPMVGTEYDYAKLIERYKDWKAD